MISFIHYKWWYRSNCTAFPQCTFHKLFHLFTRKILHIADNWEFWLFITSKTRPWHIFWDSPCISLTINPYSMMASSNGNIFRVTGHLCGEFCPRLIPAQRSVTWSFDVFFDLRLNKRLGKQSWGWYFETLSHTLWRHCNGFNGTGLVRIYGKLQIKSMTSHS